VSASDDRIRRFERLERRRAEVPDGDDTPGTEERFSGLETGGAPPPPGSPPSGLPTGAGDRFRPPPDRAPEVEVAEEDAQPFLRCMRCETDATRYAQACPNCGADLRDEAQQAYNRRLWTARRAERDELERANGERREAAARAEVEAAAERRRTAEELARQVGDQVRDRLEREQGGLWPRLRDLLRIVLGP
jgi:hypothetical protein